MRYRSRKIRKKRRINKRFIPNIFTMMNMFLGFLAIIMIIEGNPIKAGWLILIAGAFDAVDGKIARQLGIPSKFGTEFDSFADTVSFCMVPSLLVYSVYTEGLHPFLAGIMSMIPLLFGTIRLAKFNLLDDDQPLPYFIGLTTPLNALLIVGYMLFNFRLFGNMGDSRVALVLVVVLGFLLISKIRFAKFPLLSFKHGKKNTLQLIGVLCTLISLLIWKGLVLFPLLAFYVSWSVLNWVLHPLGTEEDIIIITDKEDMIL